jgi:hypothetical protein
MNHTNRAAGWGVGGHHRMHDSGSSSNSSGAAQHASNGVPWYQHTSAVMKLAGLGWVAQVVQQATGTGCTT